jgi:nickel-dependent lactate racemase
VTRVGRASGVVGIEELRTLLASGLGAENLDGKRVCLVIPDGTRRCPVSMLLDAVLGALAGRPGHVEAIVALGTHAPMSDDALAGLVGAEPGRIAERHNGLEVRNHAWHDPDTFVTLATITAERVHELSEGRLAVDVPVRVNRAVVDADLVVVIGPVLPHEVVGFSGGNKYLFPGLSGPEMIDVTHWLGALISSAAIIGTPGITPVRALIDEAASMVPTERRAVCVVTDAGDGLHAAAYGTPEVAWAEAVEIAELTHVRYLDAPVRNVLAVIPDRYDDLWTAAKGFYKVEPVVAEGGRVVLYAPALTELTPMHPGVEQIGYHTIDYFTAQWDRFADRPWGELAHSTHLRGAGTWSPATGEQPRVAITLASGVSEARTRAVNLDWADPATIDVAAYDHDPDWLVVRDAGEVLYRLGP